MKSFILTLFAAVSFPTLVLAQDSSVELPKVEKGACPTERQTPNSRAQAVEAGLSAYKTIEGNRAQFITDRLNEKAGNEPATVDFIDVYPTGGPIFVGLYKDDCLLKILVVNSAEVFMEIYNKSKGI